ncbi:MAG TPA: DMT family transporter [Candidatus Nanopelagicales bacterium]
MLCVLGSAVAFAVAPIFGKVAYAHGVDSFALLALRFASASLVVWVLVLVLAVGGDVGRPAGRTVLRVLALGALVLPAEVTLYFASLHRIGAGLAEVLLFLYPMWVVLITAVVLRQQVTRLVVGCSVVAVAGAALTVGAVSGVDGVGVLLAVGASIGFACYVVLSGRLVHGVGSILTTALITTGAAVTFSLAALVTGSQGPTDAAGWAATLGLSLVGTVVSFLLLTLGLARMPSTDASVVSTVEPAVAVLLGVLLLGEPIGLLQVVGVALVLGSVAVLVRVEAAEDVVDAGAGH